MITKFKTRFHTEQACEVSFKLAPGVCEKKAGKDLNAKSMK